MFTTVFHQSPKSLKSFIILVHHKPDDKVFEQIWLEKLCNIVRSNDTIVKCLCLNMGIYLSWH